MSENDYIQVPMWAYKLKAADNEEPQWLVGNVSNVLTTTKGNRVIGHLNHDGDVVFRNLFQNSNSFLRSKAVLGKWNIGWVYESWSTREGWMINMGPEASCLSLHTPLLYVLASCQSAMWLSELKRG
jgi:hypothetical protein